MKTKPPTPRITAPYPKLATIIVGPEKNPFVVHRDLLTFYSGFFRGALTGNFKEAQEKTVTLAEDDPTIFEFFVHWIYYQRFPSLSRADSAELTDLWTQSDDGGSLITFNLIELYVFGDKYEVAKLRKDTVNTMFYNLRDDGDFLLPSNEAIRYAFSNLLPNAPLLHFLTDAWCYWKNAEPMLLREEETLPGGFLLGVANRYAELIGNCGGPGKFPITSYSLDLCDYHEHAKDTEEEKKLCGEQVRKKEGKVEK